MATLLEVKIDLDDNTNVYSIDQLQIIYTQNKMEWEKIMDHLVCPVCGLKMKFYSPIRQRHHLRRYPDTNHDENCPYLELRSVGQGKSNRNTLNVGLDPMDVQKKARYALQTILPKKETEKTNSRNKRPRDKQKHNINKDESKGTSVVPTVGLGNKFDENNAKPRRSPSYKVVIGGDVSEVDKDTDKNFVGEIDRIEFSNTSEAYPILIYIKWFDRSGLIAIPKELLEYEQQFKPALQELKKYVDSGNQVLITSLVTVGYVNNVIAGILSQYHFLNLGEDPKTLLLYLNSVGMTR